ncbi:hypothetical protein [Microbacterium galbinum]|uniref:Uncharacterized protein n=1 Tax=Microbacterium galbinum TaxID=2851646 RepID=A0ABY4IME3_9MICO|nr:hypothetical protein [Microbacterium galbinum]UPL13001.1 hypothetical protein KV396_00185 [Microbacterium galbinum]
MSKIWFPLQRVIRTAAAVLVAGSAILATVVVIAPQVVEAVADVLPGPVVAWLLGAIATLAAISAAISRVMAIPAVDAWLRKIGAGSTPARFYVAQINGNATPLTRRQYRAMLDGADTGTDDTAKLRAAISEHNDRIGL